LESNFSNASQVASVLNQPVTLSEAAQTHFWRAQMNIMRQIMQCQPGRKGDKITDTFPAKSHPP
jgi:hypothetical protein